MAVGGSCSSAKVECEGHVRLAGSSLGGEAGLNVSAS